MNLHSLKSMKAILALVLAGTTHGAVIYSGPQNIPIPFNFDGVYVNPVTNVATLSEPSNFDTSPVFNLGFGGVDISNTDLLRPVVDAGGVVTKLTPLILVDASSSFATGANGSSAHMGPGPAQFAAGQPGYMGFAFNFTTGGPTHYGWARIIPRDSGAPGEIVDWAYEDVPGAAITVGAVPEPAGVGLIGLAALFTLSGRRRKNA
jgi:hypothetical protein